MTPALIEEIAALEDHEIRQKLSAMYRKFTDQLMETLTALGAP